MKTSTWLGIGVAVTALWLVALIAVWNRKQPVRVSTPDSASVPAAFDPSDHGYAGWQACSECHAKRVDEFRETRHFQAIRLAERAEFPKGFSEGSNVFEPRDSPVRFEMSAQSSGATISTLPVNSTRLERAVSQVDFIYGSGAGTDEVYFTRRGDALYELPAVWLHHQECWGTSPFDPHGTGDFARPLAPQCLECHNTWIDYHRGTLNEYGKLEPQLLGVTCERCHGPAKSHADFHRSHPDERVAAHIVRPKTLSRDRQMDLCAQCHTNAVRYRRPPFSFRAGEDLAQYFRILEMRYPEDDRVANQTRYLKESRCYQLSETLTCITCHDPHRPRSANDSDAPNRSCFKCHQSDHCTAQSRLPAPVRDSCVACHMPLRNKLQVNFETTDELAVFPAPRYEHRIAVYPDAEWELVHRLYAEGTEPEELAERARLGTKLAEHWGRVARSARSEHRFLVAIDASRNALRFGESFEIRAGLDEAEQLHKQSRSVWYDAVRYKQQGRLDDAIDRFQSLLDILPNSAKTHYELGTLFASKGDSDGAARHLNLAIECDPNDPGPEALLGWLDYLAGHHANACEHYRRAGDVEPWSEKIEFMIGQCLIQLQRWHEAADAFAKALEIDPNHRDSSRALRQILRDNFVAQEAISRAERGVELTRSKSAELHLSLAELNRALGRFPEAAQSLQRAREIAELHERDLIPQVQSEEKKLENIRRKSGK